jgi:hypothetical protein
MTGNVFRRRLALVAVLAISLAVPLASGIAGGGKKKGKGLDPLAEGNAISSEAKLLMNNKDLQDALNTATAKRLRDGLPKITLKPRLRCGKEGKPVASRPYFLTEGDLTLDDAQLLFFAQQFETQEQAYLKRKKLIDLGLPAESSTSHNDPTLKLVSATDVNGNILFWTPGSTVNYCVQLRTFDTEAEYQQMVQMMKDATAAWSATCNIKFNHVDNLDDTPPDATPPQGVTFTVRRAAEDMVSPNGGRALAVSFYPGDGGDKRHLYIFPFYYANHPFDRTGVLRHELGHVIGFRHEFARVDNPPNACGLQEPAGKPLTPIDFTSVMQYYCPQSGLGSTTMQISALDKQGAQIVYGPPQ